MKNYLLKISLCWMIILGIIACIAGFGALMYLIWFMITCHWILKILITLTCIALLIIFSFLEMEDYNIIALENIYEKLTKNKDNGKEEI